MPLRSTLAALTLLVALPAAAQAPRTVSFQGVLADGGAPVTTATDVTFRLFDAPTARTEVWAETTTVTPAADGAFAVRLGTSVPLPVVDEPLWLEVETDGTALGPRTPLDAAPVALGLVGLRVTPAANPSDSPALAAGHRANTASGVGAVVAGGGGRFVPNAAEGEQSTVSGGLNNTASGSASTVAGGSDNTASDTQSTVGGGFDNTAGGTRSTVSGGSKNAASGSESTVGGGSNNTASGPSATVAGGWSNHARGSYSFAAGFYARAAHFGTFVWADGPVSAEDSLVSTGPRQFLIRAAGGVGIGTNAPSSPLTVAGVVESTDGGFRFPDGTTQTTAAVPTDPDDGDWVVSGSDAYRFGDVGLNTAAPLAELHVENEDVSLQTSALENDEVIVEAGDAAVGLYSNASGTWGSALALAEVTATGTIASKWGIARRTGPSGALYFTFGTDKNYASNDAQMRIDTDGSVHAADAFVGGGADLAEYFALAPGAAVQPGDLVGLSGGRVSLDTEDAEQVMIASSDPAFVGNPDAAEGGALVALVGQAEVRLSGPASPGDLLVASGFGDGTARAVAPAAYRPTADGPVAGRVLSAEGGRALALVGVDEAVALRAVVGEQRAQIDRLSAQNGTLEARLARIEALLLRPAGRAERSLRDKGPDRP